MGSASSLLTQLSQPGYGFPWLVLVLQGQIDTTYVVRFKSPITAARSAFLNVLFNSVWRDSTSWFLYPCA